MKNTNENPREIIPLEAHPSRLIRHVDERLMSYNIEMTEVTGGTFWKAYTAEQIAGTAEFPAVTAFTDVTAMPELMEYYPPIDLYNERLRELAKQLGPAWVRISGTWATKTYYDLDGTTGGKAPEGYANVLTKEQWLGVLDFVSYVGAKLLISVSNCAGDHPDGGPLDLTQAKKIFDFSHRHGVDIDAIEFMNEPNMMEMSGAPKGYTAADYARDQDILYGWVRANYPHCLLVGPCTTGDPSAESGENKGFGAGIANLTKTCTTQELLAGTRIPLDVFSYSTDLTELSLDSMQLTDADIQPLRYMVNLTRLDLRQNQLTDLSPLAELTRLKSLELRGNNLSDLSPLANLAELEELRLGGSGTGLDNPNISDLSPLSNLHKLETLSLPRQASIGDLSPLSGLTGLKSLTTDGVSSDAAQQITDLSPLAELTNLEVLHLLSCGTSDLSPLSNLTKLTELRLIGQLSFTDLTPISGLTEMRVLEFTAQGSTALRIKDLTPLADMTKLESLRIYADSPISLHGLEGKSALQTLFLSQHNDSFACMDIEALSGLTNLTDLTLWIDDQTTDLSPLSGLTNLRYLDLYAWNVPALSDLYFLREMHNLQSLTLYESTVTDISVLGTLSSLQTVNIREYGNAKITDWSPVDHVPNVTRE